VVSVRSDSEPKFGKLPRAVWVNVGIFGPLKQDDRNLRVWHRWDVLGRTEADYTLEAAVARVLDLGTFILFASISQQDVRRRNPPT
jgi:hypothetical protein